MSDFEVNDRRLWRQDAVLKEEESKEAQKTSEPGTSEEKESVKPKEEPRSSQAKEGKPKDKEGGTRTDEKGAGAWEGLPTDFGTLVVGLGSTALIHMGETPPGGLSNGPVDLKAAKHFIDLLGMLEQKTAGNLTDDESQLLRAFLYDLRMKYIKHTEK